MDSAAPSPGRSEEIPLTDEELLGRAHGGCGRAVEELFDRYRGGLLGLIRRLGISPPDDEDILQRAYQRFVCHQDTVRSPPAFLFTTVRNLCANKHRDAKRQRELIERFVQETRPSPPPPSATEASIIRGLDVKAAVRRAGRKCKELVEELVIRQRSYNEYAEASGIPRNSLGPAVVRCLRKLRAYLAQHGYGSRVGRGVDVG